jgi:hypothetical protein
MAKMIPETPLFFEKKSNEMIVFESLTKLSDEYTIVHSFKSLLIDDNKLIENEIDFIVLHPRKGIIVIEAKSGGVQYKDGYWKYANGNIMSNGGPFSQAARYKYLIIDRIKRLGRLEILNSIKIMHAVWFLSIEENQINKNELPPEANLKIILTKESLNKTEEHLDRIFQLEVSNNIKTLISIEDYTYLIKNAICPVLNLVPSMSSLKDDKNYMFNKLLNEQLSILNYLEEQRFATINGIAGTGKTMIAVEKSRRNSLKGETTLFLCFNVNLKNFLEKNFKIENVSYYTLDAFLVKITRSNNYSYEKSKNVLEEFTANPDSFNYDNCVIDEAQDFGNENIESIDIINIIEKIMVLKNGTFFVFFDKLQMVQSKKLPNYITDSDCKLTLYKNCRNTRKIAETSMKPINLKPKLFDSALDGTVPNLINLSDESKLFEKLNQVLDKYVELENLEVVILTTKTFEKSGLSSKVVNGYYNYRRRDFYFSTVRKFKGLEADVIIMIDIDKSTLIEDNMLFYVGASRARFNLELISKISDSEAREIIVSINGKEVNENAIKELGKTLSVMAIYKQ